MIIFFPIISSSSPSIDSSFRYFCAFGFQGLSPFPHFPHQTFFSCPPLVFSLFKNGEEEKSHDKKRENNVHQKEDGEDDVSDGIPVLDLKEENPPDRFSHEAETEKTFADLSIRLLLLLMVA